ncbi:phospholipase D [Cavenderia fasciculata]|uniref:Phospholipase D n=1 Tax=Cavenderia fasciculata TaxID=261658 RepID=F4PIZ1_CACFS|nr:phospholipase D [Cavenderia fasciculata]EGG24277.1 phospholipase D [Cavenderia fasciculata]|eukprot:XP_004362128.1 phospholipase D [Cavenderia fasciculata]
MTTTVTPTTKYYTIKYYFQNHFYNNQQQQQKDRNSKDHQKHRQIQLSSNLVENTRLVNSLSKKMSHTLKQTPRLFDALKKTRLWWKDIIDRRTMKKLYLLESWSNGNDVTIYFDGDQTFESMWQSIENAKETINIETYTIEPDSIGLKTLDLLTKAQQRGCKVKFVYDAIGSSSISDAHLKDLKESGASITKFNPLMNLISFDSNIPIMFRNHRKMIVVDNAVGYIGGMNISQKYAGKQLGTNYFRDTHVKIVGPAVLDLAAAFYSKKRDSKASLSVAQNDQHIQLYNTIKQQHIERKKDDFENQNDNDNSYPWRSTSSSSSSSSSSTIRLGDLTNLTPTERQIEIDRFLYDRYYDYFSDFANEADEQEHDDEEEDNENVEVDEIEDDESEIEDDGIEEEDDDLYGGLTHDDMMVNNNKYGAGVIVKKSHRVKGVSVQVLESNLLRGKRNLQRSLSIMLKDCKKYCYITTPYFLPPKILRRSIMDIAARGVEVRLLTSGKSDVPWIRMASHYLYKPLLESGVRIFEMYGTTLHSKTMVFDGKFSTIGSYNLDFMSQRNLEVMISMPDERIARQLEAQFKKDILKSHEITIDYLSNRSWFEKIYSFLAYQFSRIVRPSAIK